MESRKRPHADDGDLSVAKKRVLTGSNGTPHVNGVADQTEDEREFYAKIEEFRKEAIYRRMKHYSRENERNLQRIEELERRKNTCEAGLAAISACWAQLLETIRPFVKPESLSVATKDIFDIGAQIEEDALPELKAALGDTVNATQALVTTFVRLEDKQRSESLLQWQRVQTECAALRSQVDVLRKQLQDCEQVKDKYHSELIAAENRLERSHSQTVQTMGAKSGVSNGVSEDTQRKPSSPSEPSKPPSPHASHPAHDEQLTSEVTFEILRVREAKIVELEKDNSALRERLMQYEMELRNPSTDTVKSHPAFKSLQERLTLMQTQMASKQEEVALLDSEIAHLRSSRQEWEEAITTVLSQTIQELRAMLSKRDADNTRLREQRDQQTAELNERKYKESVKCNAIQELKSLAESRSDRISILQSELSRYKARLAANEGKEDLLRFFLKGNPDEARLIEELKEKLEKVERQMESLQEALAVHNQENPDLARHIQAHAEAEERLRGASVQLERYKNIYGDLSISNPDAAQLAKRVEEQAAEIERLRLVNTQHEESASSLETELDRLANAWEALDKQLKSKVYDLHALEEKVQKSAAEKAKSDNKYFAAMRDKEAIEAERKNLVRTLEKQGKTLDHFSEVEKHGKQQMETLDKEIEALKKMKKAQAEKLATQEKELVDLRNQFQGAEKRIAAIMPISQQREQQLNERAHTMRRMEEDWIKYRTAMEHEIGRLREEAASRVAPSQSSGKGGDDAEYKHMRSLLQCSTCKANFRSVIITKCMHTFCKPCVDARITTRQRKCPACNLPFAQSDVSTLYMQ